MLQELIKQLKTDGTNITPSDLTMLAEKLAELVPQGQIRRGIVSDLGELWACKLFGLKRMREGQAGYDARDLDGRMGEKGARYQVKSRSPEKGRFVNPTGTVGRFSSLDFDRAILVLLDSGLQPYEVWLTNCTDIRENLRRGRQDITVSRFKKLGKCLFRRSKDLS